MAAPVFLPSGLYRVSVGVVMLPRRMSGFPAIKLSSPVVVSISGLDFSGAAGAFVGQTCSVVVPGAGCHAPFCVYIFGTAKTEATARIGIILRIEVTPVGSWLRELAASGEPFYDGESPRQLEIGVRGAMRRLILATRCARGCDAGCK